MAIHYRSANDSNYYSSLNNWSRCKHATITQPNLFSIKNKKEKNTRVVGDEEKLCESKIIHAPWASSFNIPCLKARLLHGLHHVITMWYWGVCSLATVALFARRLVRSACQRNPVVKRIKLYSLSQTKYCKQSATKLECNFQWLSLELLQTNGYILLFSQR